VRPIIPIDTKMRKRRTYDSYKEAKMIVRWFLFETWLGAQLLSFLENHVGLAVVDAEWLGEQRPDVTVVMTETE
jgi:hypothetical protein